MSIGCIILMKHFIKAKITYMKYRLDIALECTLVKEKRLPVGSPKIVE